MGVKNADAALRLSGTTPFTLECLVRRDRTTDDEYFAGVWGNGGSHDNYLLYFQSGTAAKAAIKGSGGELDLSGGTAGIGTHHVAVVYDGTNCSLYLDGSRVAGPTALPGGSLQTSGGGADFWVGRMSDTTVPKPLDGSVDEVRVSNVARYTGATYTVPTAQHVNDANTILLWRFNDAATTQGASGLGVLPDTPAVLYNMPFMDWFYRDWGHRIEYKKNKTTTALAGTFNVAFGGIQHATTQSQVGVLVPGSLVRFAAQPYKDYNVRIITDTYIQVDDWYTGPTNSATAGESVALGVDDNTPQDPIPSLNWEDAVKDLITLPGTVNAQNGSPNVATTADLRPYLESGDYVEFGSQAGVFYRVDTITATALTLGSLSVAAGVSSNYTGTTNTATNCHRHFDSQGARTLRIVVVQFRINDGPADSLTAPPATPVIAKRQNVIVVSYHPSYVSTPHALYNEIIRQYCYLLGFPTRGTGIMGTTAADGIARLDATDKADLDASTNGVNGLNGKFKEGGPWNYVERTGVIIGRAVLPSSLPVVRIGGNA